ncbi:MAG: type IV pilus secretin PilQ [Acidobacteriota bacterium]
MNVERMAVMTQAMPRPTRFSMRPPVRNRALWLLCAALALASQLDATGGAGALARLTAVSATSERGLLTVLIEATEPVPYVTTRPDPLTLVVDLRNANAAGARNTVSAPVDPVASVSVEELQAEDGAQLARVRFLLSRPVTPEVRSRRNAILVEFGGPASVSRDAQETPPPGAVVLTNIDVSAGPAGTRVTLTGSGPLSVASVEPTKDLPPRLVVDLSNAVFSVPRTTEIGKGPVDRIRVAVFSRQPLVTRVVVDLKFPVAHRVETAGSSVSVIFDEPAPPASPAPVAPSPAPTAPAAAEPQVPPKPVVALPAAPAEAPPEKRPAEAMAAKPAAALPEPAAAVTPPTPPKPDQAAPSTTKTTGAQVPSPSAASETLAGAQAEKQYTGHPITFDFTGADLRAVLRTFSEISGLNVIIDPNISGPVDVSLREVPWDQALEIILRANKLGYVVENNVVRIAPLTVLAEEETQRRKLAEEQAMAGQLKVLTRSLSYARATDLQSLLVKSALTQRGQVQVDPRTNTIIITDLPSALEVADNLISTLDQPEPQVEIEARIVQTSRDAARALGVQWGLSGRMASELGNTSPLAFPAQGSVSGRVGTTQGNPIGPVRSATPTGVDLGVQGATSSIGLAMGTLNGSLSLDVALSAIEKQGQGRVLSTPRVMMQNNVEAEMTQGVQIPIQTVSNNTVTVTFKDAALMLKVKPQITASNTVIMDITLENASPDYSRQVNGIPPIDTQRAKTQVLVHDYETTVIGGIVVSREQSVNDRVPMLHKIPLLGWLFKRDSIQDEDRELLIFITPRIRR